MQDFASRPSGEDIDRILYSEESAVTGSAAGNEASENAGSQPQKSRKKGLFAELQQFLRALSQ
ncbi:MAG: hypothetical protein AAFU53_08030 [Cyanobacteria bacterium J06632_3]